MVLVYILEFEEHTLLATQIIISFWCGFTCKMCLKLYDESSLFFFKIVFE